MNVLAIITARGGSKGIPRKNLALLAGKPLLSYTAEAALAAQSLARVVLSTDDDEIAALGRQLGLDVPFMRPQELARDQTPTLPVLQDVVQKLEAAGDRYDAICLLQPTSPLRTAADIDCCVAKMTELQVDSVITVLPVPPKYNPHWVYFADSAGQLRLSTGEEAPIPRRQELPPAYHRDGSIYIARRDTIMLRSTLFGQKIHGHVIDSQWSVNIDEPADLLRAESLLRAGRPG